MDIICTQCGEPWDIDHVIHEEPEAFDREGCLIRACPCCQERLREGLPKELVEDLKVLAQMAELLGDDVDGFACFCEDHWPLKLV